MKNSDSHSKKTSAKSPSSKHGTVSLPGRTVISDRLSCALEAELNAFTKMGQQGLQCELRSRKPGIIEVWSLEDDDLLMEFTLRKMMKELIEYEENCPDYWLDNKDSERLKWAKELESLAALLRRKGNKH